MKGSANVLVLFIVLLLQCTTFWKNSKLARVNVKKHFVSYQTTKKWKFTYFAKAQPARKGIKSRAFFFIQIKKLCIVINLKKLNRNLCSIAFSYPFLHLCKRMNCTAALLCNMNYELPFISSLWPQFLREFEFYEASKLYERVLRLQRWKLK